MGRAPPAVYFYGLKPRSTSDQMDLWHRRFAHPATGAIHTANRFYNLGLSKDQLLHQRFCVCPTCMAGKAKRTAAASLAPAQYQAQAPLAKVSFDLVGPISVFRGKGKYQLPSLGGSMYGLIGVDHFTGTALVKPIADKSQAAAEVVKMLKALQVATGSVVKHVHTDGGLEFNNRTLTDYLSSAGIKYTCNTAHTSHTNGRVERLIRTLAEMVRMMLHQSGAPITLWGEALVYAAHVYNCTPNATTGGVPYQALYGFIPNVQRTLKVFGCDCWWYIHEHQRGKFEPKWSTSAGIYLGYDESHNSYRVLNLDKGRMILTRDVRFDENAFTGCSRLDGINLPDQILQMEQLQSSTAGVTTDSVIPPTTIFTGDGDSDDECIPSVSPDTGHSEPAGAIDAGPTGATDEHQQGGDSNSNSNLSPPEFHADAEPDGLAGDVVHDDSATESASEPIDMVQGGADSVPRVDDGAAVVDGVRINLQPTLPTGDTTDSAGVAPTARRSTRVRTGAAGTLADPRNYHPDDAATLMHQYGESRRRGRPPKNGGTTSAGATPSTSTGATTRAAAKRADSTVQQAAARLRSALSHGRSKVAGRAAYFVGYALWENQYGLVVLEPTPVPNTYKQAMASVDKPRWVEAMVVEIDALDANHTWELVPCPAGVQPLTCRWVYTIKRDQYGNVEKYKARLVVRGFLQRYGVDFTETFAPVVKFKSIKLVLALAAQHDWELKQIDFKNAFLNAPLDEDVYIFQPEGFEKTAGATGTTGTSTGGPKLVCKLNRALYGLKQAPRAWNKELHKYVTGLGYHQLWCDPGVYTKRTSHDRLIILCLYVDDTVIAYDKQDELVWLADKQKLQHQYKLSDLGDCQFVLQMVVDRDRTNRTIKLSQKSYIDKLLVKYGMAQANPTNNPCTDEEFTRMLKTPAGTSTSTSAGATGPVGSIVTDDVELKPLSHGDHTVYMSIVGSLMYAANTLRPDIAYATGVLARSMSAPAVLHLKAAKRVLRYLKGTADLGLTYTAGSTSPAGTAGATELQHSLVAYTDASWANDLAGRKSCTGAVIKYNGCTVSWLSRKQPTVSLSSTEAEYMAATTTLQECLWIRGWLSEVFGVKPSIQILCDNQSAIALTGNDSIHQRSKHIDIRFHFIRDYVTDGVCTIKYIGTNDQEADILTKAMKSEQFKLLRDRVMVSSSVRGGV